MLNDDYLFKGITALSRAGSKSPMAGHTGAAVIAAYFFCRENRLEESTQLVLQEHVDTLIAESGKGWYSGSERPEERGALFMPYPKESSNVHLLRDILSAVDRKIALLRESGHCTIFASLALKTLNHLPDLITPSIVGGICQLIESFDDSPGKMYVDKEKRWIKGVPVEPDSNWSPYQSPEHLVIETFNELLLLLHDKILRTGYGGLVHLTTHTNALVDLAEMGYGELARKGYRAHQTHILSLQALSPYRGENGEVVHLQPTKESPLTYAYWKHFGPNEDKRSALRRGGIDHAVKVSYAFFHLIPYMKNPEMRDQVMQHLGYIT